MSLSKKQLALLHVAKKQLGLSDDDWRAMLLNVAGVDSSRDLAREEFEAVLHHLRGAGFASAPPPAEFGHRPGMASAAQVAFIRDLWLKFTDGQGTARTLDKWLDGHFKVSSLRFVDSSVAHRVIGALQKMVTRRRARPKPEGISA